MEVKRPVDKIRAVFPGDPMLAKNSMEASVRSGQPAEPPGAGGGCVGGVGLSPSCSAAQHRGAQCGCAILGLGKSPCLSRKEPNICHGEL